MGSAIKLPEGFVLDTDQQDQPQQLDGVQIPEGFVLDTSDDMKYPGARYMQAMEDPKDNLLGLSDGQSEPAPNMLTHPVQTLAKDTGENIGMFANMAMHPIQTATNMLKLGVGGMHKLAGPEYRKNAGIIDENDEGQKLFDATTQYVKGYGNPEEFKRRVLENPVSTLMDFATVLTAGGGALKAAGKVGKIAKVAQAGAALGKAGAAIDPVAGAVRGVGKAVTAATAGRKIAPFFSAVDDPILKTAKEVGVDLPASAVSKSKAVPLAEAATVKSFFGGNLRKKVQKAYDTVNKYADDIVVKTNKSPDMTSAGHDIAKGANAYKVVWRKTKNELYKAAGLDEVGAGIPVKPVKAQEWIKTILDKENESAKISGVNKNLEFWQNIDTTLSDPKNLNAKTVKAYLESLNRKIGDVNDPVATGYKAELKALASSLSDDLDAGIVGSRPDLQADIEKANKFYREGLNKLNSTYGEKIFDLAEAKQYDKIVPAIMNKSTSIDDIPRIFEVVGKDGSESLRSAFLEDFFAQARGESGNFKSTGITSKIASFGGDAKLKALLTPEQYTAVKNIEKITQAMGKLEKVTGGSQTAFITRLAAEAAVLFTNPALGLKIIVGDYAFSRIISSKAGQKLLTTGLELTGETGRKIQRPAGKIGTAARIGRVGGLVNQQEE